MASAPFNGFFSHVFTQRNGQRRSGGIPAKTPATLASRAT
jgi:hypothetical protein